MVSKSLRAFLTTTLESSSKNEAHTDTQCESVVRMFGRMLEHDRRQLERARYQMGNKN